MLDHVPVPTPETDMAKQPTQPSLEDLSPRELEALIERATALKTEKKAETIQALRARWQDEAEEAGITLSEVFPPSQPPSKPRQTTPREPGTRTPARIKYRFPDDTEWSGKGRIPLGARSYLIKEGVTLKDSGFFEDLDAGKAALEKFLIPE